MNKQARRTGKTRSSNSQVAIARDTVVASCKRADFAQQLHAAVPAFSAIMPHPSLAARVRALLIGGIQRLITRILKPRSRRKKLALLETQALGEKRFVAIVRVGKQKFLIGGAAGSVSLLAEIHSQRARVIAAQPMDRETA